MLVKFWREHVAPLTSPIFFIDAVFKNAMNNGIRAEFFGSDRDIRSQLIEIVYLHTDDFQIFHQISSYINLFRSVKKYWLRWRDAKATIDLLKRFSPRFFFPEFQFRKQIWKPRDSNNGRVFRDSGGGKKQGPPRLIIPRTFESNRRLIISRFFPTHCASSHQRSGTEAERSPPRGSRNNRGIPLLIFTAFGREMDHSNYSDIRDICVQNHSVIRPIRKSMWNQRVIRRRT